MEKLTRHDIRNFQFTYKDEVVSTRDRESTKTVLTELLDESKEIYKVDFENSTQEEIDFITEEFIKERLLEYGLPIRETKKIVRNLDSLLNL